MCYNVSMTKPFVHIHSSSRYDRSKGSLFAAAVGYNSDADLVTYTEVEFEGREQAVRKANGDAFGMVSGDESNANDAVISYKKSRFKLLYKEMFKATNVVVYRPSGKPRDPVYATIAVLEDKLTGAAVVVAVIHLASSVEGDLARRESTNRALQWSTALRNTKRRVNKLAKQYGAAHMIVADFNINFKKLWARLAVKAIAPSYLLTWRNVKVPGGTHGNRIIDATLLRGAIGVKKPGAYLYKDDPSSDHRPYIETLVWL